MIGAADVPCFRWIFRPFSSAATRCPATRPKGSTLNRIARIAPPSPTWLGATLLVALFFACPALAQNLSDAVISASPVTDVGKNDIALFIADHAKGLSSADAAVIRKAKNALVAPLNNPQMSESFRREYGTQLVPIIGPLTTNASEPVALNALRIAGTLGTNDGLQLAIRGLDDKRTSVRMMGASSTGLAIGMGRTRSKALSSRNATDALDTLNTKMQAEQDTHVLDTMMLALEDAMHVKAAELDGVRTKATNLMLAHASRLARDTKGAPGLDSALAHATKALGEAMLDTGPDKLLTAQVQEAGGVAGDVVARILRRLDAGLTDAERSQLGVIAKQCEAIVQRGTEFLGLKGKTYNLDDLLHEGKDAEFRAAAQNMFRDLVGTPFDRKDPADRYPAKP